MKRLSILRLCLHREEGVHTPNKRNEILSVKFHGLSRVWYSTTTSPQSPISLALGNAESSVRMSTDDKARARPCEPLLQRRSPFFGVGQKKKNHVGNRAPPRYVGGFLPPSGAARNKRSRTRKQKKNQETHFRARVFFPRGFPKAANPFIRIEYRQRRGKYEVRPHVRDSL